MGEFGGVKNEGFFDGLEVSEGTFIRTYLNRSCLGCIVEGFV